MALHEGHFVELLDEPSTPLLEQQLSEEGVSLAEGYATEVNLNISPWMEDVARRLARGYVVTIDYGYHASELYSPQRSRGTLITYYKHTFGTDPYVRIGAQDMTTHVDFTDVIQAGDRCGLSPVGLTTQRQFLLNLGFNGLLDALAGRGLSYHEYLANRFAMLELVWPEGMGDFQVLIQGKGVYNVPLYGLSPSSDKFLPGEMAVPLLNPEHIPLLQAKYPHYFSPWNPFEDKG